MAFSPDGTRLATGDGEGTVWLWDASNREQVGKFSGHTSWVRSVVFSPDGSKLVTTSNDGTMRLWDVGSREQTGELGAGPGPVAFSPDGTQLASTVAVDGIADRTVQLWIVT